MPRFPSSRALASLQILCCLMSTKNYQTRELANYCLLISTLNYKSATCCKLSFRASARLFAGTSWGAGQVRDIVTERRDFNYSAFIPMLTTRIRVLNPSVRQHTLTSEYGCFARDRCHLKRRALQTLLLAALFAWVGRSVGQQADRC